jgi:hypothetical protein
MMAPKPIPQSNQQVANRICDHTNPFTNILIQQQIPALAAQAGDDALPTRFSHPGDLALQAQQPETDSAHPKPAKITVHSTTQPAPVIASGDEFRLCRGLISEG